MNKIRDKFGRQSFTRTLALPEEDAAYADECPAVEDDAINTDFLNSLVPTLAVGATSNTMITGCGSGTNIGGYIDNTIPGYGTPYMPGLQPMYPQPAPVDLQPIKDQLTQMGDMFRELMVAIKTLTNAVDMLTNEMIKE